MKKHYTMAEAIGALEFGEVMVKVGGITESDKPSSVHSYVLPNFGEAFFYDENDGGILKSYRTMKTPIFVKAYNEEDEDSYVIMDAKVYENIKNKR